MNPQDLIVNCYYTKDGATVQDIVRSSFITFLKKELEQFASIPRSHV